MFITQSSEGNNRWWRYLASAITTMICFFAAQTIQIDQRIVSR